MTTVLTFLDYYCPGFKGGGPIQTVSNMVDQLDGEICFKIVTRDRDLGESKPYSKIQVDGWERQGAASVWYCSPKRMNLSALNQILESVDFDIALLNSFFSPSLSIRPIYALRKKFGAHVPIVLAPRGEFSDAALRIKSIKKRLFLATARMTGLYRGVHWLATSQGEKADVLKQRVAAKERVTVIANLPRKEKKGLEIASLVPKSNEGEFRIVFLARVSPVKNLEFVIQVLSHVKRKIHLTIAGPIEDRAYWASCAEKIDNLPSNINVECIGAIDPQDVRQTIESHDLFFMPSKSENYGHSIVEALQAGVPVLISDRTPWRNLEQLGIGADLPLSNPDLFVQAIERFAVMSPSEKLSLSATIRNYSITELTGNRERQQLTELFNSIVTGDSTQLR